MTIFYWTMAALIGGTLMPATLFFVLFVLTGEDAALARARVLWNISRVFSLFGINILIWGHVLVALWRIWFH